MAVTKDSEPAKEHLSDRSRDDFVYSGQLMLLFFLVHRIELS